MFRVPIDSAESTFDDTFKVSFWRWLTSRKPERVEWMRRRNAAAEKAREGQNARGRAAIDAWAERHKRK
jgi:hypothetical protein